MNLRANEPLPAGYVNTNSEPVLSQGGAG
jgi:hypothetical protein